MYQPAAPLKDQPNHALMRRLRLAGIVFALVVIAVVAWGMISRALADSHLKKLTDQEALPSVSVNPPTRVANESGLDLPGRLQAFIQAPIYARVPGYLKSWHYDIGAKVKAGEVLAEIDTPDLDQQLAQARANLNVARANEGLAKISAERWQSLAGTDAVAKQDVDERNYAFNANQAQVKAGEANVEQLTAQEGFKRLISPFDGIVTARNTDVGALINVGAAGGQSLFVVSAVNKLRIYVNVPQNFVPSVPAGTQAQITLPDHPGKTYTGKVEASAQAVDPATGTTLMQIIVDNAAGDLLPGAYASVHLQTRSLADVYSVPASAMIFNAKGLFVATVVDKSHVQVKPVSIARDLGQVVELATGINQNDRVIENPPDGVATGDVVQVVKPHAKS